MSEPTPKDYERNLVADLALCEAATPGPYTSRPQAGPPKHCLVAQVWGPDGRSLAEIEPSENEAEATALAAMFAAARTGWPAAIRLARCYRQQWYHTACQVFRLSRERNEAIAERDRLLTLIRWHRDQYLSGDDKCWKDNERLYAEGLPEGYTPPARDTLVELENCQRYIASCHDPRIVYVSPQRRIAKLEAELTAARKHLQQTTDELLPLRRENAGLTERAEKAEGERDRLAAEVERLGREIKIRKDSEANVWAAVNEIVDAQEIPTTGPSGEEWSALDRLRCLSRCHSLAMQVLVEKKLLSEMAEVLLRCYGPRKDRPQEAGLFREDTPKVNQRRNVVVHEFEERLCPPSQSPEPPAAPEQNPTT